MPASFDYSYPVSAVVSDNESYTTKGLLILKECASGVPNGCEGLWNQNLCGSDEYYAQPFVRGDKLYLQFHFDKLTYTTLQFFIVDCTTLEETEISGAVGTVQECQTDSREYFQNVEIDTTNLPKCFYVKVKLYDCVPGLPAFATSYISNPKSEQLVTLTYTLDGTPVGPVTLDTNDLVTTQANFQAALSAAFPGFTGTVTWFAGPTTWQIQVITTTPGTAYIGMSPTLLVFVVGGLLGTTPGTFAQMGEEDPCPEPVAEHCSEPYQEVRCEEETLVIESTYPKTDCFGNFYNTTQDCATNIFINRYRIPGELIQDGYDFIQTKTADIDVSVTTRRRYTLLLPKLPPYVVDRIAIAFGGQEFKIDGTIYEGNIKIDKDFEYGRSWIVKTTLFRECSLDFGCE